MALQGHPGHGGDCVRAAPAAPVGPTPAVPPGPLPRGPGSPPGSVSLPAAGRVCAHTPGLSVWVGLSLSRPPPPTPVRPRQWLEDALRENETGSCFIFLVGTKKDLLVSWGGAK